jgi:hypothetical protein
MLGMRIHAQRASSVTPLNIAGEDNIMADVVSRAFKDGKYFVAHGKLTHYFNANFPLPQQRSWREFTLPHKLTSRVISCLRGELLPLEQLLRLPVIEKNTGTIGSHTQKHAKSTLGSLASTNSNWKSSSLASLRGSGQATTVEEIKSQFRQSRTAFRPSPRPSNWLENQAPSTKKGQINTKQQSSAS